MILLYAILIGLAAFRMWRIIAEDSIAEPIRDWLYDTETTKEIQHRVGNNGSWTETVTKHRPVRQFLQDLMFCPWCIGFWYAGVGAWLVADAESYNPAEFALVWLAASAVCGITQKAMDR